MAVRFEATRAGRRAETQEELFTTEDTELTEETKNLNRRSFLGVRGDHQE
jgi:hypothetical protein